MEDLTEASLESWMANFAGVGLTPTKIVVPVPLLHMTELIFRSFAEGWDRRRFKREARRAETSTYHKRPKT